MEEGIGDANKDRKSQMLPDRHSNLDNDRNRRPATEFLYREIQAKVLKNVIDRTRRAHVLHTEPGSEIGKDCKQGRCLWEVICCRGNGFC